MTWYAWVLLVILALNVILVITRIDEPRKPLTRGDAIVVLVCNALFAWAIIALAAS